MDEKPKEKKKKKLKHAFQGCIKFEGKVYLTFAEFILFCQTFKYLKGGDLASVLERANIKESPNLLDVEPKKKSLFDKLF